MAKEGATVVAADVNINNVKDTVAELTGKTVKLNGDRSNTILIYELQANATKVIS